MIHDRVITVPTLWITHTDTHTAEHTLVIRSCGTINQHVDLKSHRFHPSWANCFLIYHACIEPSRLTMCGLNTVCVVSLFFFYQKTKCLFCYQVIKLFFPSMKQECLEEIRHKTKEHANSRWGRPQGELRWGLAVFDIGYLLLWQRSVSRADSDAEGLFPSCWWCVAALIAVWSLIVCSALLLLHFLSASSHFGMFLWCVCPEKQSTSAKSVQLCIHVDWRSSSCFISLSS